MNFKIGSNVIDIRHLEFGVGVVLAKGSDKDYLVAYPDVKNGSLHSGTWSVDIVVPIEYRGKCWWSLEAHLIGGTLKDYEEAEYVSVNKEGLRKVLEAYEKTVDCSQCYVAEACRLSSETKCISFLNSKLIKQEPPPTKATCLTAPTDATGKIKYITVTGTYASVYGVPIGLEPEDLIGKTVYYKKKGKQLMYWGQPI